MTMFVHDLLADSIAFWEGHQDWLDRARARVKTGEPCPHCDNNQRLITINGGSLRYLCCCYIVGLEVKQASRYRDFSNLSASEKLLTFASLKRPSESSQKQWDSMLAARDSLISLAKSPYNHKWVKISGVPGAGKTHMLLSAYNRMTHAAIYLLAGRLARQLHDGIKREGEKPEEWVELNDLLRMLIGVPVLLLDDLGSEHEAPFVNNMITDIITQRYQFGESRPTVVATNLTQADMEKRYRRVESRLSDMGLVLSRPVATNDYRKLKVSND